MPGLSWKTQCQMGRGSLLSLSVGVDASWDGRLVLWVHYLNFPEQHQIMVLSLITSALFASETSLSQQQNIASNLDHYEAGSPGLMCEK